MEKNQGIGVLLIFVVIAIYYFYTAPSAAEFQRQQEIQDSIKQSQIIEDRVVTENKQLPVAAVSDSVRLQNLNSSYGPFSTAMVGTSQVVSIENNNLKIDFDTKGGKISNAHIKDFYKIKQDSVTHEQSKLPLSLLEDKKNKFQYLIPTERYGNINTADLYFTPQISGNSITLTATLDGGQSISQVYTLASEGYKLDYDIRFNNMNQVISSANPNVRLQWHNYLDKLELNDNFERFYSTVYFKENNESSDYCNCRSDDIEELPNKKFQWVSHVNQFFNTSIIAEDKSFQNGIFETVALEKEDPDLKLIKTEYDIALDLSSEEVFSMNMYIGPNEYSNLKGYAPELEQIIPFGRSFFGSINRHIIRPVFNWLSKYIGSKGLVIIFMIFMLKMILYPLMYKMLYSQAKMSALKPELADLKVKYKDEPQKAQMETMKIYREYGVSPLGGCMPMILQMPIWYALFRFFPASITFRQESFLWATDLSSYDVIAWLPFTIPAFGSHISLFTILWAISTVIYSFYNMRHMDMSANPAMKYVQYFMPLTFLFFFNTYASGLTCYMFFSNLFNIAQTVITKKFVFNDEKIRTELMAAKAKPKKKGGFQAKLEEAMKNQQNMAKKKGKK